MPVVKTPRAIIEILDSEGHITGHEIESHYVYESDDPNDPMLKVAVPKIQRDEATEAEVNKLRKKSSTGLTDSINDVTKENAVLQEQMLKVQESALAAVNAAEAKVSAAEAARDEALGKLQSAREALK